MQAANLERANTVIVTVIEERGRLPTLLSEILQRISYLSKIHSTQEKQR